MKRLFFYLSLLLLSSPTHASHTFDETTFARGFTIYQSLSYQWMESRERIAKQGLNPFIEDVKEWMGAIAIMQPDVKERLPAIAETIKKTAPDIHKMLNTMLNNNQKAYKRPPLLSSLDVSKAGILFQALGQHYENTDAFIEEIVQNDLPRAVSYKIFNEWCESIDPSLKMFSIPTSLILSSHRKKDLFTLWPANLCGTSLIKSFFMPSISALKIYLRMQRRTLKRVVIFP